MTLTQAELAIRDLNSKIVDLIKIVSDLQNKKDCTCECKQQPYYASYWSNIFFIDENGNQQQVDLPPDFFPYPACENEKGILFAADAVGFYQYTCNNKWELFNKILL